MPKTQTLTRLRFGEFLLVLLGGAAGTALREGLSLLFPGHGPFPWTILAINLSGALMLGALLETLALRGPDQGARRRIRLLCGTGVLGGYTTYSTFAVGIDQAWHGGHPAVALAYALVTVAGGFLAALAGVWLSRRWRGLAGDGLEGSEPIDAEGQAA